MEEQIFGELVEDNIPQGPFVLSRQPDLNADWSCFDLDPPHPGYSPPSTPRTPDSEPAWGPNPPATPNQQPVSSEAVEAALLQYLHDQFTPVL